MDELLDQLKAISEPTRLRMIAALESCELSVSEVCEVLGQTQPRVSRHLKLLTDAGLLRRHAEGTNAYYGLHRQNPLLLAIAPLIDRDTPVMQRDQARLEAVRRERAERAEAYFADVASDWDELREMHAPTSEVEQAMLAAVTHPFVDTVLDIGTGTGRILELFADRTSSGVGIDRSRQMLSVARARLDDDRLSHCSVRHGDIYDLDVPPVSQDVVVLHHVLHFLADPASAIAVAAERVAIGGTLLIVDFATHSLEHLRTDHAHSQLGFSEAEIQGWCHEAGLQSSAVRHFPAPPDAGENALTVTLWAATNPAPAFDAAPAMEVST